MKKSLIIFAVFSALVISTFASAQPTSSTTESAPVSPPEQNKIVKAVEVQGNKAISLSTILSKVKVRIGEEYRQNIISDDLKRLYNTGYFSDVRVDHEDYEDGFKVIIYVTEKPVVDKITFSRIRYLKPRALQNKLKIKEGKFLDSKSLRDDVETVKELYAKKGLTDVSVDVETNIDAATNKASLHFVIKEGQRVRIKRIDIAGNEAFRDKKIIKVIKTRPDSLLTSGFLKEDVLREDMERIASFYEKEGFIDAEAEYSLEEYSPGRLKVHINIKEGQQYFVGNININNNDILTTEEILAAMKYIREGGVFSREKLQVDIGNIQTLYFDRGYIFANVKESTSLNSDTGKVEITLDVREGGLAYVNKVKIEGNTQTRDIVIRRELRLEPGDQFDGTKLRRSKERLRNLGYFEEINYDIEDTNSPNQKDLVVQVKETKTGTFSFGGGFSTVDRLVGFVEIEQRNFDFTNWPTFTGGGQNLTLRAETGSVRSNKQLSFTEPWLFDYPISAGFDIYQLKRDRERDVGYAYDEERIGGDIRLGKELTEFLSGKITYKYEETTIDDFDTNVSTDLLAEAGTNSVSDIALGLVYDKRDSTINPTRGYIVSGSPDVAGSFLGGDKDFYRFQASGSYFIPLKFESVLELRLRGGWVDAYGDSDTVPIFERFFAGGARTIRGYDERKVGPIDPLTEDPIGGESLFVANIEYTVPIIDFLKLAGFFDTGNVWPSVEDFGSGDFKSGFGLGLRVRTPIGPVNLDYGYPLDDEPGEEGRSGKFYFSVSRGF